MIEICKEILDTGGFGGTHLTDLSKAFDCLKHDLPIAKYAAYGFNTESMNLIFSYFSGRAHRTKINKAYSNY